MINLFKQLWTALTTDSGWKPEGDCDDINWFRCKMERWEKERREAERRVIDMKVEDDRRSGSDRRQEKNH